MSNQPIHYPEFVKGASVAGYVALCGEPRNPNLGHQQFTDRKEAVTCEKCCVKLGMSLPSKTYQFHNPNESQSSKMDYLRREFSKIESFIRENISSDGDYRAWALKDLQSAAMWANKAITHVSQE